MRSYVVPYTMCPLHCGKVSHTHTDCVEYPGSTYWIKYVKQESLAFYILYSNIGQDMVKMILNLYDKWSSNHHEPMNYFKDCWHSVTAIWVIGHRIFNGGMGREIPRRRRRYHMIVITQRLATLRVYCWYASHVFLTIICDVLLGVTRHTLRSERPHNLR